MPLYVSLIYNIGKSAYFRDDFITTSATIRYIQAQTGMVVEQGRRTRMKKPPKAGSTGEDHLVQERIEAARELFEAWEGPFREDVEVVRLLNRLKENIEASYQVMRDVGVVRACRWCEEEAGGSCCGTGIENRYSRRLLLINLLLGVSLPDRRWRLDSCYFLKDNGCSLKARHVLCVNYLCQDLQKRLVPDVMNALQETTGKELDIGFVLYETVGKIIDH